MVLKKHSNKALLSLSSLCEKKRGKAVVTKLFKPTPTLNYHEIPNYVPKMIQGPQMSNEK